MGYSIELVNEHEDIVTVPYFEGGSIRTVYKGGKPKLVAAEITVTYNYSKYYANHFPNGERLWWFNEKTAKDTVPVLKKAMEALGTKQSGSYWNSTAGNAGYVLSVLLEWAKYRPDAVWRVD